MVRVIAGLCLVLGMGTLFGYLHWIGKSPLSDVAASHLRERKDRMNEPDSAAVISFAEFGALPRHLSVAEYSGIERRAVTMEGYVQRMLRASDGDFHLELVATPRLPEGPDTLYVTAEVTPGWRDGGPTRGLDPGAGWNYSRLAAELRPNHGGIGPWPEGPARVRLTGWLLYDYAYDTEVDRRGLRRDARLVGWEIHPVTRIERWDERAALWREVAR